MATTKSVRCGVIATIFAGTVGTADLVWGKMLKDLGLPYFRIMGFSAFLSLLAFALVAKISGPLFPKTSQTVWAMLRAVFGTLTFVTMIIAVQIGAAPGDVSALTSINIVFAGLFGHLFLSERLRCMHILALLLSISGAVLIAKPEIIFGESDSGRSSVVGNLLALSSGLCISCVFICARLSVDISMSHMACYTAGVVSLLCFVLPLAPFIGEVSFSVALASPWKLLGLVGATLAITVLKISLNTIGSVACPAAVSATVRTGSSMVFGYMAQTLLFDMTPEVLTIVGAVFMLAAVVIMASVRVSQRQSPAETENDQQVINDTSSNGSTDTAQESLASFVAAEYAEWEPHINMRLRKPSKNSRPLACTVGLGSTVAAIGVVSV